MKGFREQHDRDENHVELNECLSFYLDAPDRISLHVGDVKKFPLSEKLRLLWDGLDKLAELLVSDSRLKDIKTITATSWIVTEHPHLLEKLGFTIDHKREHSLAGAEIELYDPEDGKGHADPTFAWISREDFLDSRTF